MAAISSRNISHTSTAERYSPARTVLLGALALVAPAAAQAPPATTAPIEHLIVDVGENLSSTTCLASVSQGRANGPFQITKRVGDDEPIGYLTRLFQF